MDAGSFALEMISKMQYVWNPHTPSRSTSSQTSYLKIDGERFPPGGWQPICFHFADGHWPDSTFRSQTLPPSSSGCTSHPPFPDRTPLLYHNSRSGGVVVGKAVTYWGSHGEYLFDLSVYLCIYAHHCTSQPRSSLQRSQGMSPLDCGQKQVLLKKCEQEDKTDT